MLKNDLEPEDSNERRANVAMRFNDVVRVARVDHVALVIVGMRENRTEPPALDCFKAWNVDLKTGVTAAMDDHGLPRWRFLRWAQVARGRVADAVFPVRPPGEEREAS